MTVKELITRLGNFDPELEVWHGLEGDHLDHDQVSTLTTKLIHTEAHMHPTHNEGFCTGTVYTFGKPYTEWPHRADDIKCW